MRVGRKEQLLGRGQTDKKGPLMGGAIGTKPDNWVECSDTLVKQSTAVRMHTKVISQKNVIFITL